MKKNKMLRTASAMLILTIITISIIGGALAKYTTEATGSDTAVVAKFGVTATVSGDLFGKFYKNVDGGNGIGDGIGNDNSVKAKDESTTDVLAPGTQNLNGMKLSVTGTPEVATKVILGQKTDEDGTYANSDIYLEARKYGLMIPYAGPPVKLNSGNYYTKDASGNYNKANESTTDAVMEENGEYYVLQEVELQHKYFPLKWYVNYDEAAVNNTSLDNVEAVIDVLYGGENTIFGKGDEVYYPGASNFAKSATVGWIWSFDTKEGDGANDGADTILGSMIAAYAAQTATPPGTPIDVVVINDDRSLTTVKYEAKSVEITKPDGSKVESVNKVVYASADTEKVACLTAAFNVSLKVEQVD